MCYEHLIQRNVLLHTSVVVVTCVKMNVLKGEGGLLRGVNHAFFVSFI